MINVRFWWENIIGKRNSFLHFQAGVGYKVRFYAGGCESNSFAACAGSFCFFDSGKRCTRKKTWRSAMACVGRADNGRKYNWLDGFGGADEN